MGTTVTLKSLARKAQTFNLPGITAVRAVYPRAVLNPKTGDVIRSERRVVHPESLTLLAGEECSGLPPAIARCPEVASAVRRGLLRIVEDAAPAVASEESAEPVASAPERRTRGRRPAES